MHRHARHAFHGLVILASATLAACSDNTSPAHPDDASIATPTLASPPATATQQVLRVEVLSGRAADSAIRARAHAQAIEGDTRLATLLDTSATWSSPRLREAATNALNAPRTLPTTLPDLTGVGTPPAVISAGYFPKPVIVSSQTTPSVNGSVATFSSAMIYSLGTSGSTDMTYDVKGSDGTALYPQHTEHFSEVGQGATDCAADIMAHPTNPICNLWGVVSGLATVTLAKDCDFKGSVFSTHNAALILPIPSIDLGSGGKWGLSFSWGHLSDAAPVGNALSVAEAPKCSVKQQRQVAISDGGPSENTWIVMPERQVTTTCYALQSRTVQSDGYASPWATTGVECYSSSVGSRVAGSSSGAFNGTAPEVIKGVPFTLAAVSGSTGNSRAQIIRRGRNSADSQADVIAIPANATPDDVADAVDQLSAKAGNARQFNDAAESLGSASKGKGAGKQKDSFDALLKELKKAKHSQVSGVGDATAMSVIVVR